MGSPYRILLTAAIVAGPGSRFAVARVANLSATAPQRALPVVPSSLSYPFPCTILRLKSEGTGIHSAALKKNGSAKSMQPIFGFSIGSMGTDLYFAILSRISERDRTPLPSPKASHESEIGKWTKRVKHADKPNRVSQSLGLIDGWPVWSGRVRICFGRSADSSDLRRD